MVTRSTTRPKPLHKVGDCECIVGGHVLCATRATFLMVRVDKTTLKLCTRHANVWRAQIDARPDAYNPVRFTAINPTNQLSKDDE
jgi:hypothetical protein